MALLLPNVAVAAPTTQVTVQNATDATFNQGIELYNTGQWQAALDIFTKVQQTYQYYNNIKRNGQAWEYIGHAKLQLGDLTGAVQAYQNALPPAQVKGDTERQAKLNLYLSRALYDLKEYEQALTAHQAALQFAQALKDEEKYWVGLLNRPELRGLKEK
jgi:tetratricopeptide (TPR) repeat protein